MQHRLRAFLRELQERKVLRVASLYAIFSWVLIQIAATTFPFIGLGESNVTTLIILLLLGFPIALIVAWVYKVVAEDEVTEAGPSEPASTTSSGAEKSAKSDAEAVAAEAGEAAVATEQTAYDRGNGLIFWLSMVAITIIVGLVVHNIIRNINPYGDDLLEQIKSNRVAVLIFENNTGQDELDVVGKMAADWITQQLIQVAEAPKVVSYSSVNRYTNVQLEMGVTSSPASTSDLAEFTGAAFAISGAYYLEGDSLIFNSQILDTRSGELLYSFEPERCALDQPLSGIEVLSGRLSGYWATRDRQTFFPAPPTYDAYQQYLAAEDDWVADYDASYDHLLQAIELDSAFLAPRFKLAFLFVNLQMYREAAEVVAYIEGQKNTLNRQQKNLLSYFQAMLLGDSEQAYRFYKNEYELDPRSFAINTTMAIMARTFVNNPQEALDVLDELPAASLDLENCAYCWQRIETEAEANISLGNYREALRTLELLPDFVQERRFKTLEIRALARLGRIRQIRDLIETCATEQPDMDVRYLNYSAAREFELLEREDLKLEFGQRALALYQDTTTNFRPNQTMMGRSLYLLGRLEEAEQLFADRVAARPNSRSAHAYLGIVQAAQGKTEEALARIDSLSGFERQYDLGYIPYRQARIYAKLGQVSNACEQLNRALTEGQRFIFTAFSNEPDFLGLKDERCFRPYLDPS